MISIRWKFQFFFFFFSHARRREEGRGEPIARIPSVSSFSRTVPSSPPSYLFSSQWSSLRFRFHVSISQQVSSFQLDGDLSFLFIFPSSSSSLSSSYRNAISSNESLITKLSRTKKRKRVYEEIDERTFPRISTNLRENRRDFSLWKNSLGTRENLSPRSDLFGEGLDTWRISRSRTTTIRFLFACFFRRTSVVLFFPFLFKKVISPDDKLSERRNSRIQRSSTRVSSSKKKRRKRREKDISKIFDAVEYRTRRKKRWKKNVFVKYGRKGTIPVFLGWWKVSSTMTETSPGDEEKLGRSLFHRSCIRTIPGEKSGGKCVYHSKLLIPNEWMERREENIVRFRERKKEKEDSISTLRILREIRGLEGIRV